MKKTLGLILITVICLPLLFTAWSRFFREEGIRALGSNVIFISIDTLRADHLGCYGYERETSPNMDRFAAENLLFINHMVTMSTTIPSHASMFTGLHPRSHGVLSNHFKLGLYPETLADIVKGEGYLTAGFVSAIAMHPLTGISRGFDYYSAVNNLHTKADHLYERLVPWLEANRKEKFFLFLHFFDPHNKYEPPTDYRKWGREKGRPLRRRDPLRGSLHRRGLQPPEAPRPVRRLPDHTDLGPRGISRGARVLAARPAPV